MIIYFVPKTLFIIGSVHQHILDPQLPLTFGSLPHIIRIKPNSKILKVAVEEDLLRSIGHAVYNLL